MAKTMAYIEDHQVMNLLWCDDRTPQTDELREVGEVPAAIGDYFDGTHFYRWGRRVLTDAEQLQQLQETVEQLDAAVVALEYENTLLLLGLDGGGEWDAV